jgi:hypothetical protein
VYFNTLDGNLDDAEGELDTIQSILREINPATPAIGQILERNTTLRAYINNAQVQSSQLQSISAPFSITALPSEPDCLVQQVLYSQVQEYMMNYEEASFNWNKKKYIFPRYLARATNLSDCHLTALQSAAMVTTYQGASGVRVSYGLRVLRDSKEDRLEDLKNFRLGLLIPLEHDGKARELTASDQVTIFQIPPMFTDPCPEDCY